MIGGEEQGSNTDKKTAVVANLKRFGVKYDSVAQELATALDPLEVVEDLKAGRPINLDTWFLRRKIEDRGSFLSVNPLSFDLDHFSAQEVAAFLKNCGDNGNLLINILNGDIEAVTADTQIAALLSSIWLVHPRKVFDDKVATIREQMKGLDASRQSRHWQGLHQVAAVFCHSPVFNQVQQLAESIAHNPQTDPTDQENDQVKLAANRVLAAATVLRNPGGFMEEAYEIFKEVYGVDLKNNPPIGFKSPEGRAYQKKLREARLGPETQSKAVEAEQPMAKRVNKTDGLDIDGLKALAHKLKVHVNINKDYSGTEGVLRLDIATDIITRWVLVGADQSFDQAVRIRQEAERAAASESLKRDLTPLLLVLGSYGDYSNEFDPERDLPLDGLSRKLCREYKEYGEDGWRKIRILRELARHLWGLPITY